MGRRDPRDRGCCSINFLEYVLHVFNLLFLAAGFAVLGVSVWTVFEKQAWLMLLTNSTFVVTTYLLVSAGAAVVVVAVIGWCVISREVRCGILMYSFLLLVIFLVEALAGMLGYIYAERVYLDMQKNLNATFLEVYYFDASKTAAIDALQQEYRCCGAVRFEDWEASRWFKYNATGGNTVPDSCCKSQSSHCGIRNHPSNIYYDGCIHRLVYEMRDRLIVLGAVGSGLCLVQIFGIIFTFCLYYKLRDFRYDMY